MASEATWNRDRQSDPWPNFCPPLLQPLSQNTISPSPFPLTRAESHSLLSSFGASRSSHSQSLDSNCSLPVYERYISSTFLLSHCFFSTTCYLNVRRNVLVHSNQHHQHLHFSFRWSVHHLFTFSSTFNITWPCDHATQESSEWRFHCTHSNWKSDTSFWVWRDCPAFFLSPTHTATALTHSLLYVCCIFTCKLIAVESHHSQV